MDKDLIELIKSKLPEAEVGAVKAVLADLDKTRKDLESARDEIVILREESKEFKKKYDESHANNVAQSLIEKEKQENAKKAEELKVKELELKADVPKAREEVMKYVFDTIFKVPKVREDYQEIITAYGYNSSGTYSPNSQYTTPVTKTVTQE